MTQPSAPKHLQTADDQPERGRARIPWIVAFCLMVCFIWGNSMVPGEDSGNFSLMVLSWIHGALGAVGLPYEWLSHLLLRKMAHFTEYMVLGLIGMQAFGAHRDPRHPAIIAATAMVLAAIPCIDETIQLFVAGRSGQPTDVLIDCSGALTGMLLTFLGSFIARKARKE